jgi:hypothetical protein
MRRVGVIVALGALLSMIGGAATATPALAVGGRGDGWQFVDFGPGFTTDNCGFSINVTVDVDNVFGRELTAPDGSTILQFNGAFKLTWTNPDNGKSISMNAPGPTKITVSPDGMTATSTGTGRTALDLTPADAKTLGVPPVFVFAGRGTATIDLNTGNVISGSIRGHILVNICAALS